MSESTRKPDPTYMPAFDNTYSPTLNNIAKCVYNLTDLVSTEIERIIESLTPCIDKLHQWFPTCCYPNHQPEVSQLPHTINFQNFAFCPT